MRVHDVETRIDRPTDRELIVTRTIGGPARLVFEAWARPELFKRWWALDSFGVTIVSFEADFRTGGSYRLEMGHPSTDQTMAFYGRYLEVVPNERIVWTNEEGGEAGPVTTVTLDERDGVTLVTVHDLYPSKEALDEAIESGSTGGWSEQLSQLDAIVAELAS